MITTKLKRVKLYIPRQISQHASVTFNEVKRELELLMSIINYKCFKHTNKTAFQPMQGMTDTHLQRSK